MLMQSYSIQIHALGCSGDSAHAYNVMHQLVQHSCSLHVLLELLVGYARASMTCERLLGDVQVKCSEAHFLSAR